MNHYTPKHRFQYWLDNVRVLFRSVTITNPAELECLAIAQARTVILRPMDNNRCITCILALNQILEGCTTRPRNMATMACK